MPTVKIPPVLRAQTDGEAQVSADGATVGEVLRSLAGRHPRTESQLFSPEGDLNRYVNIYLNDEDVRMLDGLETSVADADTVVILPAMAGGGGRLAAADGVYVRAGASSCRCRSWISALGAVPSSAVRSLRSSS